MSNNTAKSYQQAIDVLTSSTPIDYKSVVVALAKQRPSLFLEIVNTVKEKAAPKLLSDDVIRRIHDSIPYNKVQAIKDFREVTGFGLKDSKDVIDVACEFAQGQISRIPNHLSSVLTQYAKELVKETV